MNTLKKISPLLLCVALLVCCLAIGGCRCSGDKCEVSSLWQTISTMIGLSALGAVGFLLGDAVLKATKTLPGAASTTVNSAGLDLEEGTRGDFLANAEILISAPALTTTILPDTRTMTYSLYHDTDSAFGTETLVYGSTGQILQTGAGGAGAAAATFRGRLPTNVKRYIRLKITSGASTTDGSATSATLQLLF